MGKDKKTKPDKQDDDDGLAEQMEGLDISEKGNLKKKGKAGGDNGDDGDAPKKGKQRKAAAKDIDIDDDEDARPAKGKKGGKGKKGHDDNDDVDVKPKGGKKGKKGYDEDDEEVDTKPKATKKGKKGHDDDDDEFDAKPKAGKKGKKGHDDEDDEIDIKPKGGKKGKKGHDEEDDEMEVKPKGGKKGKKEHDDEDDEADVKPKGGKKGKKAHDDDDDEADVKPKPGKKGKKGKKKGDDSDEDDDNVALPARKKDKRKGQKPDESLDEGSEDEPVPKGKKGGGFALLDVGGDASGGSEEEPESVIKKPSKKDKKKKKWGEGDSEDEDLGVKKGGFGLLDVEEGESGDASEDDAHLQSKVGKKQKTGGKGAAGGFALLEVEDVDDDIAAGGAESEEEEKVVKEDKKKKEKKKKKKKKDEDEDELDKMLEELALEIEGKKPPAPKEAPKGATKDTPKDASAPQEEADGQEASKRKKKKDKKGAVKEEHMELEGNEESAPPVESKKSKKKKEKKEAPVKAESEVPVGESKETMAATTDGVEAAPVEAAEGASDEEGDDKKKKKKKKKKDEEEDKKKLKRPGNKQIAAIQEHLKKLKEEEERRKEEEEAKIRAEEEAERLRQEKVKLEQERKEKKKQKEKERREKAKAEGRLLTKAQKTARARMEATLKAFKEQGIEVPQIGEKRQKVTRTMDRRKKKKPEEEEKQGSPDEVRQVEVEILEPKQDDEPAVGDQHDEVMEDAAEEEEEEEGVKDAWDATSSEEEEDEEGSEKKATPPPAKAAAKGPAKGPAKPAPKKAAKKEEASESESESSEESESESEESEDDNIHSRERVLQRLQKQREEAEKQRSVDNLRSPVICVLGHVDTGKTKILDTIRHTHVQDSEAGGITQQIGATMVPLDAIKEQCKMTKDFPDIQFKIPGLLIIDTPGHESFSNLRSRGSSLCDMAILVVDLMHGLEPQTIESLNMLRARKTPFVVALNKVDRLYDWKGNRNKDIVDVLKAQSRNTRLEFEERTKEVVLQFAEQGMNAALFHENADLRTFISLVPTSALSGDGMGNLISLIVSLTQDMMAKRISFSEELQATVLEVKAIPGLGTTIDVILVNGRLREGDTMVLAGHEGPFTTPIRSLLMPQPLKELRVKNPYQEYKEVKGAQGVKIAAKDLDKAIAGLQVWVAKQPDEVDILKEEVAKALKEVMSGFKLAERGVYVQASTLGSLEALLEFLRVSKIPYSGIRIGPVVKKDVMKASIMLEHDNQYAVILAFDVKVERDAQELADSLGVKIFQADIIYHLFDKFTAYRDELKQRKREEFKSVAVFPCRLRILPQFVFNSRDPIVVGVSVEAGIVREGTPLCVPSKEFLEIGTVTTIEINHKQIESARKGQEVCIKIESSSGDAPKMYGRHFDHTDFLVSKITRQSIDACKDYFRDDLVKTDWQLMVELKKLFQIL
ncbi:eukaryotic translation initiation factor 5B-like [Ornithodoros turicata]|uniref:eukaryotic translation initiation factor 5B-like n=1 Tax=Ornithodoros turicata TaxID=34597 RepID=UPI003139295B